MSKGRGTDQTGHSKKEPRHVRLYLSLLNTEAWNSLISDARATLIEVMKRYNGVNNGLIPLSVREVATALHIGKSTAAEAFEDLQWCGFISSQINSSFDWKTNGDGSGRSTRWRLTQFKCDAKCDNPNPSYEFLKWKSPADDVVIEGERTRVKRAEARTESKVRAKLKAIAKRQNAVRPQVRSVPGDGQSVPEGGHSPRNNGVSVPQGGHSGEKASFGVPEDGQYIVYQGEGAVEQAQALPPEPLLPPSRLSAQRGRSAPRER